MLRRQSNTILRTLRALSSDTANAGEKYVYDKLHAALATDELSVKDMSGGCGTLYAIAVTSAKFRGLSTVQQHRLVNDVLKENIKTWHGLQLTTSAPDTSS